tara:strand:+ start:4126 stop:4350 length:225 start_codon:yes stop_codon:yes gene_type:complete
MKTTLQTIFARLPGQLAWTVHNVISHPLMELTYWISRPFGIQRARIISTWVHDCTIPMNHGEEKLGNREPSRKR